MKSEPPETHAPCVPVLVPEPIPLESVVRQRLRESGHGQLRHIACRCDGHTARLTGRLTSYHLKQTAQEIVRRVEGVQRVQNHLLVVPFRGKTA